jgi:hypothetical protein
MIKERLLDNHPFPEFGRKTKYRGERRPLMCHSDYTRVNPTSEESNPVVKKVSHCGGRELFVVLVVFFDSAGERVERVAL